MRSGSGSGQDGWGWVRCGWEGFCQVWPVRVKLGMEGSGGDRMGRVQEGSREGWGLVGAGICWARMG